MKIKSIIAVSLVASFLFGGFYLARADVDVLAVSAPQETIPPNIASTPNKPMMMLASSKDHTLFAPIYTDFEDIDGDGFIDTTFKPNFKYYGYFDSSKCYVYQNSRFEPNQNAIKSDDGRYSCSHDASLWSGNFMNWVMMTRVDVIRKMLYGGKRSADQYQDLSDKSSTTVLERANLSKDAHSFVKHYVGTDIRDYTPFTVADLTKTSGKNSGVYAGLTMCNRSSEMTAYGTPQIRLAKGNYSMWGTINGDVCRWDKETGQAGTFGAKLSRYFLDVDKGDGRISHEEQLPTAAVDGINFNGLGTDLTARVRVCVPSMIGEERCQAFPLTSDKNLKPYGLFQEFGLATSSSAAARAEFGVITGSYDNNLTAGALRKNIGDFADEINLSTGQFCHNLNSGCAATLTDGRATGQGAIKSIDSFVLFGRSAGGYDGSGAQLPGNMKDGSLPAWGNPVGEMVVQAFRYFAAAKSSNPTSTANDGKAGLPVVAWKDPLSQTEVQRKNLYGDPICRPMYTLALSSSALSFDANAIVPFGDLPNKSLAGLSNYVDLIGVQEGINGTSRSVGAVGDLTKFGETCAGKPISNLSLASGICPEAPAIGGTYQVAGASLYANTSKIRNPTSFASVPTDLDKVKDALKVKTLAASLAGGVPRIEVPIPNQTGKYVYITPESLWNAGGKRMPGGMLSFTSINSGALPGVAGGSYGTFVVTWNDSLFGGDYDMDITGFIRYDVRPDTSDSKQYNISITTDIINVGAGYLGTHGFSIIGTDHDGRYLTHQHTTGWGIEPIKDAEGYLCGGTFATELRCNVSSGSDTVVDKNSPYTMTFKMLGVDNVILQDPLWYAAKYGYFDSSKKNPDGTYTNIALPPNRESWDNLKNDGSVGADGTPDGYFLARRPEILEEQLRKALNVIASMSNAAPAISTSVLTEGALKYAVKFDSTNIVGQLEAYKLLANGDFSNTPLWEAGNLLQARAADPAATQRQIITNDGATGVAFRWENLVSPAAPTYRTQMTTASTNKLTAANAEIALNYIRGDQSHESTNGLRQRGSSLLGPIVNSSPWVQQRPLASWGGGATGYGDFYTAHKARKSVLWVGANDGMLHAFNADSGTELFAYVPGALANRLAEIPLQRSGLTKLNGIDFVSSGQVLPSGTVWPYVDGNVYTADVKIGSNWKTYAFGSLGRGGRGVFALDATDIASLTEVNAANVFKWQFTAADDGDLGYQTSDIKIHLSSNQASPIARMNNGKFAMILGNGQRSVSGKAVLYVLYMDGPSAGSWSGRYQKIVVDNGTGNGLSTPRWEDLDGDGTADVVYAGDIKGNVWKFDFLSSKESDWGSAIKGAKNEPQPFFQATSAQGGVLPITTAPELVYMARGGLLVTFATGNAFAQGDFGASDVRQSVFGIWDRTTDKTALLRRSYTRLPNGYVVASTTDALDWSKYRGWAIDLPGGGEAVLTDPSYDAGVLSFVSTRPRNGNNECNTSPSTTLYTVDPIAGMPERSTQGYTYVDGVQVMVAGKDIGDPKVRMVTNRRPPPKVACKEGDSGCSCKGGDCSKEAPVCGPGQRSLSAVGRGADATICYSMAPRLQWREIPGLRTYPD